MTPKLIKEDLEVRLNDITGMATVYKGGLSYLTMADNLIWRADTLDGKVLTLSEIAGQLSDCRIITVIVEYPLDSKIYQYGNYGNSWYQIAEGCGYA